MKKCLCKVPRRPCPPTWLSAKSHLWTKALNKGTAVISQAWNFSINVSIDENTERYHEQSEVKQPTETHKEDSETVSPHNTPRGVPAINTLQETVQSQENQVRKTKHLLTQHAHQFTGIEKLKNPDMYLCVIQTQFGKNIRPRFHKFHETWG